MKCYRFIVCTILAFAIVGAFLCVPSFAAPSTAFVLSARTTDGDSTQYPADMSLSGTYQMLIGPLNTYAEENGFELIGYEGVSSTQTTDAPVYYHFNAPDGKSHYYITLAYNVNLHIDARDDDFPPASSVATYKPTSTDDSGYLYSYTAQTLVNSFVNLEATFAVWEYPSDMDYNAAIMILDYGDYGIPMDPVHGSMGQYSFYFPIYAPQIVSDYDEAIFIIENIVTSIEGQTEDITDAVSQQTEDLKDYFDGEDDPNYNLSEAEAAEEQVENWFNTADANMDSITANLQYDFEVIQNLLPYFNVPFTAFSGAILSVAVIYFVQRVLL